MRFTFFIIVIFLACGVVSPYGWAKDEKKPSAIEFTNAMIKERCSATGGEWILFNDGCADTCYRIQNENVSCPKIFRNSCECGQDKCWDTATVACVSHEQILDEKSKK